MPLGLVPGVRIQDKGWPFQEVHHCATHVMVAYREKRRIYATLTTKLLSHVDTVWCSSQGMAFFAEREEVQEVGVAMTAAECTPLSS